MVLLLAVRAVPMRVLFLLFVSLISAGVARSHPIGVILQGTDYDAAKNVVVVHLLNASHKDATAWNIKITESYASGERVHEYTEDVFPLIYAIQAGELAARPGNGTFAAGAVRDVTVHVQPGLTNFQAALDTVIYNDKTAETTNTEALGRMTDFRRVYAQTTDQANQIIESALANPADATPGETAANKIDQLVNSWKAQPHTSIDLDTGLLEGISDSLRNARASAAHRNLDLRTYLQSYVETEKRRATAMSEHSRPTVGGAK
jgi:hypothetical protein